MGSEISKAPEVRGIEHSTHPVGSRNLKIFNGLGSVVMAERELGAQSWQINEVEDRILRKTLL